MNSYVTTMALLNIIKIWIILSRFAKNELVKYKKLQLIFLITY